MIRTAGNGRPALVAISTLLATGALVALSVLLKAGVPAGEPASGRGWRELEPGLELGRFPSGNSALASDSAITVLRVDPTLWELRLLCASAAGASAGEGNLTARQWAEREGLAAAINSGMYATDYRTHIGYLRSGSHVNCASISRYQSVAAFDPRQDGLAPFRIFDLDAPGTSAAAIKRDYQSVVQNLRLIKRPGENRWEPGERAWSEAALGEDSRGRALLIFSRSPRSMHEFNDLLLSLPLDLQCAQHLEGGPEAQLYVRTASVELELTGGYETGFTLPDGNADAWPVPNVLGVARVGTARHRGVERDRPR